jgi:competence factor transporting protein
MINRYRKYYTSQVDERDCGVAALNMVLRSYGSDYAIAHLRELAKTNEEGTTALGIVKAAEELGFTTNAVRADMNLFSTAELTTPFIVHVLKKGNLPHYYTVFSYSNKHILVGDPDDTVGIHRMSVADFEREWTGIAIFFAPKPAYMPQKESQSGLLAFVPILFKQRGLIVNIVIAAILTTVISIASSYFLQAIIDTYIPNAMTTTLAAVAFGLIVAYVFSGVFGFAQAYLMNVLGQRLTIDVTLGYVRHLFELPMSFFATRRTGEIVSRFTDASKIIDALASTMLTLFLDVWIVLAIGVVLAIQNIRLFGISLIAVPLYILIVWVFRKPFDKMNQDTMEADAELSSSIIENLTGIETVKALAGEQTSYHKIDHQFADLLKKSFRYGKTDELQQALKSTMKLILGVFILWFGSLLVMQGKMSLGQLLTYNALLTYFTNPLESIIDLQPKLQMAKVANRRLNEVYLVESEFKQSRHVSEAVSLDGDITLRNVSFRYGYAQDILHDINLHIPEFSKSTIVGMSGSGKTTLAKLLIGFYEVSADDGEIRLGNVKLNDIGRQPLRQYINYVPQDAFVFSGTVLENLTLGSRPGITDEDVRQACSVAEILTDIENLPMQFQEDLSENGSQLSGGQKQRLAIARALLSPAKVLIFDESTSALDTITERHIVNQLLAIANRTIIFVAHRLTIAEQTDNVIVLDHGQVVEQGTHDALLARNGVYARLVNE